MQTCYDLVWLAATRAPNDLAIVDDISDRAFTYQELINEIDKVAAGLFEKGVKQGMRIATVLPSLFDHAIALLALQRLAAVPALMNFRLTPNEIGELVKLGEIEGAIILPDKDLVNTLINTFGNSERLFCVGDEIGGASNFAKCRGNQEKLDQIPTPDPEDLSFIFYTSGTTGLPKGVELSHRTTEHRILWLATHVGFRHGNHNKLLGFMPLSHAIGFYGVFLAALSYNGTYYVQSAFNPSESVNLIEKYQITYMFAVPQLYFAITQAQNYNPKKMSSLKKVLYGGAEIMPDFLVKIDKEWPAKIFHIYGTTEIMCPLYNPDPVGEHVRLRPGFYCQTRVIKIGGRTEDVVGKEEEGELIVEMTPDQMFSGYLNRADANEETIKNNWYHTGDVCFVRKDGDYELIGRTGDIIRSGGENIHPSDIETHLITFPEIIDVSVIGIKDPNWGEMAVACVVCDKQFKPSKIKVHLENSSLAKFKFPKAYLLLENLPRNAANKVLRRELIQSAQKARQNKNKNFIEV